MKKYIGSTLLFLTLCLALLPQESASAPADNLRHVGWTAKNRDAINTLIRRYGDKSPGYNPAVKPVATLDWDNTMILNDIGEATFLYLIDTRGFKFSRRFWRLFPAGIRRQAESYADAIKVEQGDNDAFARYRRYMWQAYADLCAQKGDAQCYAWQARLLAGFKPSEVRTIARATLDRELAHKVTKENLYADGNKLTPLAVNRGIRYYPEMRALVARLQNAGFVVWIVSASPQHMVETAAGRIGITPERVIGILNGVDRSGHLTAELKRVTYREGKAKAIRVEIGVDPVFSAGDSNTDIEMLEMGDGLRLVIDRGKEPLMSLARQEGWLIQQRFYQ